MSAVEIQARLKDGRQLFSPKRTIETSVFLGPLGHGKLSSALFKLMGSPRKVAKNGYTIRNFDWNGTSIIRPCDVHLGVDMWDVQTGDHLLNATYSEESLATMYSLFACGGVLFGNGETNLFRDEDGEVTVLSGNIDAGGFVVTQDRSYAAGIDDNADAVSILSGGKTIKQTKVPFPLILDDSPWKSLCFESVRDGQVSLILHGSHRLAEEGERLRPLARLNVGQSKFTTYRGVPGLQNIALSPIADHIVAITTNGVYLIDSRDFETIAKLPINERREQEYYVLPPIQYSPCGRYFAYSVAASGDIEVVDARAFKTLARLQTGGLPKIAFEWSYDGRFLATAVFFPSGGPETLFVWDIENSRLAAKIKGIRNSRSDQGYAAKHSSFHWRKNRHEFAVLMTTGDIIFHELVG